MAFFSQKIGDFERKLPDTNSNHLATLTDKNHGNFDAGSKKFFRR